MKKFFIALVVLLGVVGVIKYAESRGGDNTRAMDSDYADNSGNKLYSVNHERGTETYTNKTYEGHNDGGYGTSNVAGATQGTTNARISNMDKERNNRVNMDNTVGE